MMKIKEVNDDAFKYLIFISLRHVIRFYIHFNIHFYINFYIHSFNLCYTLS